MPGGGGVRRLAQRSAARRSAASGPPISSPAATELQATPQRLVRPAASQVGKARALMIEELPPPARQGSRARSDASTIHASRHPPDLAGSPLRSPPGERALLQPLGPALQGASRPA